MDKIKGLFLKYRELISYLFFGGLTTLVSWASYALFVRLPGMTLFWGNVLSWVCAVLFAFVTNKLWVFNSKSWAWPGWLKEAAAFFAGRIFSGLVEMGGFPLLMWLGLDQSLLGIEGFAAKVVISVVVIVLNYILSKFLVFRRKQEP